MVYNHPQFIVATMYDLRSAKSLRDSANPCEPDPCNGHGVCSPTFIGHATTCECDAGYAGMLWRNIEVLHGKYVEITLVLGNFNPTPRGCWLP
jgi:hypothetical protein